MYIYGLWHRTAFGSSSPLDYVVYQPAYMCNACLSTFLQTAKHTISRYVR